MDDNGLAAIIGLTATILGLIIGRYWETRSESAKWRRDQRTLAYNSAAKNFYAIRDALRELAQTSMQDAAKVDRFAAVTRAGIDWNSAVVSVWLFGSEEAASLLQAVDLEIDELAERARARQFDFWAWHETRRDAQACFERFLEEVRVNLSLPKFDPRPLKGRPRVSDSDSPRALDCKLHPEPRQITEPT